MAMSTVQTVLNRAWNACPSSSQLCPDSQTPTRIATYAKDIFKSISFDSIKSSKWTYVVLASTIFLACIYKIYKLREENNSLKTNLAIELKTSESNNKELKLTNEKLADQLKEKNDEIGSLKLTNEKLAEQLKEKNYEIGSLKKKNERYSITSKEAIEDKCKQEIEKYKNDNLKLQEEIDEYVQELEMLKVKLASSQESLEKANTELKKLREKPTQGCVIRGQGVDDRLQPQPEEIHQQEQAVLASVSELFIQDKEVLDKLKSVCEQKQSHGGQDGDGFKAKDVSFGDIRKIVTLFDAINQLLS